MQSSPGDAPAAAEGGVVHGGSVIVLRQHPRQVEVAELREHRKTQRAVGAAEARGREVQALHASEQLEELPGPSDREGSRQG